MIPSPELQEWRIACQTMDKTKQEQGEWTTVERAVTEIFLLPSSPPLTFSTWRRINWSRQEPLIWRLFQILNNDCANERRSWRGNVFVVIVAWFMVGWLFDERLTISLRIFKSNFPFYCFPSYCYFVLLTQSARNWIV